jgi:GntR family transcriptional repressor for pyruvate dehydrogenase complex
MAFEPLVTVPVYQQVADQIAEAILAGDFPPGDSLPNERELSRQFAVSRTTIREGLRALQARGLVASSHSRTRPLRIPELGEVASGPLKEGLAYLIRLRRVELEDLVELRSALEMAALESAARSADRAQLDQAHQALVQMHDSDVSVQQFHEANVQFHLALVAASRNQAIRLVMLALRDSIAQHLLQALRLLDEPRDTIRRLVDEHTAILKALEGGEGKKAGRLVRQHIVGFYEGYVSPSSSGRRTQATTVR